MSLQATTAQTVGPYFRIGLEPLYRHTIASAAAEGERVRISGQVFDGDGLPVSDACLEIWQADAQGRYHHPEDPRHAEADAAMSGFARVPTDAQGAFAFTTIKPGRVAASGGGLQAPHLMVSVFMRGLLKRAATRIYFADDPANADDPALLRVPAARRATLMAVADGAGGYRWDVRMQGGHETVFFAV